MSHLRDLIKFDFMPGLRHGNIIMMCLRRDGFLKDCTKKVQLSLISWNLAENFMDTSCTILRCSDPNDFVLAS